MDRLYTPWRRKYVTSLHDPQACVLCDIRDGHAEEHGILVRTPHWYAVLNKYPYTTGHMMIVTQRHLGSLAELNEEERAEYPALLARAESALREAYRPQGLNVGLNLGRAGGAGVVGHVHWHILPRWGGDTNFVTVIGDSRVLPETLEESFQKLAPLMQREG